MSWNRRVMRHPNGELAIHEVHYDEAGNVTGWSKEPSEAVDAEEGLHGLRESIETTHRQSLRALSEEIIDIPAEPTDAAELAQQFKDGA
jgi:hypothetical protein